VKGKGSGHQGTGKKCFPREHPAGLRKSREVGEAGKKVLSGQKVAHPDEGELLRQHLMELIEKAPGNSGGDQTIGVVWRTCAEQNTGDRVVVGHRKNGEYFQSVAIEPPALRKI